MLDHAAAIASVYVTGLSLGCLNSHTKKWEVCFLRDPRHTLTIEIFRLRGGVRESVRPVSVVRGHRIIIEARLPADASTSLFQPGRRASDQEDFRLLVDIEKLVYKGKRIRLKRPGNEVTEMYVSGAVLYTLAGQLSEFPVRLVRKDRPGPGRKLGRVGVAAGADIVCKPGGGVVVRVEGQDGFQYSLDQEAGVRYVIMLDNQCPPSTLISRPEPAVGERLITKLPAAGRRATQHSDFSVYYDVVDPEGKGVFDLEKDEPNRGDGAVCNYTNLGKTNVLFPLPITE